MAGHDFDADAGLAINLAPGDSGIWQSMMLDPLPAGNYELRLRLAVAGEGPVRLDVAVRPLGAQGEPMGDRRLLVPVGRPDKIIITRSVDDRWKPDIQDRDHGTRGERWREGAGVGHVRAPDLAESGRVAALL